ncbi:MAG: accessory factor UbiK family protein [Gammaproteobacteria bacterium]|nr:accessory factor UbiK family protein [Gammaproteobacteria bacterium]
MRQRESLVDDLTQRFERLLPKEPGLIKEELQGHLRAVLHSAFDKAALVTREEFDIQVKVLTRTRERLEQLERRMAALENQAKG